MYTSDTDFVADFLESQGLSSRPRRQRGGLSSGQGMLQGAPGLEGLLPGLFDSPEAYRAYEDQLREGRLDPYEGIGANLLGGLGQATEDAGIQIQQFFGEQLGLSSEEDMARLRAYQQQRAGQAGESMGEQIGFTTGQVLAEGLAPALIGARIGAFAGPGGAVLGGIIGGGAGLLKMYLRSYDGGYNQTINEQIDFNRQRVKDGLAPLPFDSKEANIRGFSAGATEVTVGLLLNRIPGGKQASKPAQQQVSRGIAGLLSRYGKEALTEGAEEAIAEVSQATTAQVFDMIAGREDFFDRADPTAVLQSFVLGAAVGGIVSVPSQSIQGAIRKAQDTNQAGKLIPAVQDALRDSVVGETSAVLESFSGKDADARQAELNARGEMVTGMLDKFDALVEKQKELAAVANDESASPAERREAVSEIEMIQDEITELGRELKTQKTILDAASDVHESLNEGKTAQEALGLAVQTAEEVVEEINKRSPVTPEDPDATREPLALVDDAALTPEELSVKERLERLGASRVVFYDGGLGTDVGAAPAFYNPNAPGTIFIRRNNTPLKNKTAQRLQYLGRGLHEMLHLIQHTNPELYQEIERLAGKTNALRGAREYFNRDAGDPRRNEQNQRITAALAGVLEVSELTPQEQAGIVTEGLTQAIEEGAQELTGPVSERLAAMGVLGTQAQFATKLLSLLEATADAADGVKLASGTPLGGMSQQAQIAFAQSAESHARSDPYATPHGHPSALGPRAEDDEAVRTISGMSFARPEGYGKAKSNVTESDVRNQVPEGIRKGSRDAYPLRPGEPVQMVSGKDFATYGDADPVSVSSLRATKAPTSVRLTQQELDQIMEDSKNAVRLRHGDDAIDQVEEDVARRVALVKTEGLEEGEVQFAIGNTRDGIDPSARGVLTEEQYQDYVNQNPGDSSVTDPQPIYHVQKYDGKVRTPNAEFVSDSLSGTWAQRFWYEAFGSDLIRAFPFLKGKRDLVELFASYISATSPRTEVRDNLRRAIGLMAAHMGGRPTNVTVMDQTSALEAARGGYGRNPGQYKVGSFNQTLGLGMGTATEVPMATLDVIMARFFGIPQEAFANPLMYELGAEFMGRVADAINAKTQQTQEYKDAKAKMAQGQELTPQEAMMVEPFRPWQLQAAMWSNRLDDTGTFSESLDEFLEQAYEAGQATKDGDQISMSEDQFTEQALDTIIEPASEHRGGPRATVEVATEATKQGRRSNHIGKYLLAESVNPDLTESERAYFQNRLAELFKPNNAFLNTLSAKRRDIGVRNLLDMAMEIPDVDVMLDVLIDPAGMGVMRGTINKGKRSKLYDKTITIRHGKKTYEIKVRLASNETLVENGAGADLNRPLGKTTALGQVAKFRVDLRTTSPSNVNVGQGPDGGAVITGPLGAYPDTDGDMIVNNVVNVVVPGLSAEQLTDAVRMLSVGLAQEAAASHVVKQREPGDTESIGPVMVFVPGVNVNNTQIANVLKQIDNKDVNPLVQQVSNGTIITFADFEAGHVDPKSVQQIEGACLAEFGDGIKTAGPTQVALEGGYSLPFGSTWEDAGYPEGQIGPTQSDITKRENEIILEAAEKEIDNGTWYDGIPIGEGGQEVFESEEAFLKRQEKLQSALDKKRKARRKAEQAYDAAVESGDAAAIEQTRTDRALKRTEERAAKGELDGNQRRPKRTRALNKKQRELIEQVAPTREDKLALIAPSVTATQGSSGRKGRSATRAVWERVAQLDPDDRARVIESVGRSQAFRLHHFRSSLGAHRADFLREQQEANDKFAGSISKRTNGAISFARERSDNSSIYSYARVDTRTLPDRGSLVDDRIPGRAKQDIAYANKDRTGQKIGAGLLGIDDHYNLDNDQLRAAAYELAKITEFDLRGLVDDGSKETRLTGVIRDPKDHLERTVERLILHPSDVVPGLDGLETVGDAFKLMLTVDPRSSMKARLKRLEEKIAEIEDEDLRSRAEMAYYNIESAQDSILEHMEPKIKASQDVVRQILNQGVDLDIPFEVREYPGMAFYHPPAKFSRAGIDPSAPAGAMTEQGITFFENHPASKADPEGFAKRGAIVFGPEGLAESFEKPKPLTERGKFGANSVEGIDVHNWLDVILHEFAHARTVLAIQDELQRVLGTTEILDSGRGRDALRVDEGMYAFGSETTYPQDGGFANLIIRAHAHPSAKLGSQAAGVQQVGQQIPTTQGHVDLERAMSYLSLPLEKQRPWMRNLCIAYVAVAHLVADPEAAMRMDPDMAESVSRDVDEQRRATKYLMMDLVQAGYVTGDLYEFTAQLINNKHLQQMLAQMQIIDTADAANQGKSLSPIAPMLGDQSNGNDHFIQVQVMRPEDIAMVDKGNVAFAKLLEFVAQSLGIDNRALVDNRGRERTVLELALGSLAHIMENAPETSIDLMEARQKEMQLNAVTEGTPTPDKTVPPIVFARKDDGPKERQPQMRGVDRERQLREKQARDRLGSRLDTVLQTIMDREKQRLVDKKGMRPDIAALSGITAGVDAQKELSRQDKKAALDEQMRKMRQRQADLKAERVQLEEARQDTRKFIQKNLPVRLRGKLLTKLTQAKTEAALLKVEREVLNIAAQGRMQEATVAFTKRAKALLRPGVKMSDETRQKLKAVTAKAQGLLKLYKEKPTAAELDQYEQALHELEELHTELDLAIQDDRDIQKQNRAEFREEVDRGTEAAKAAVATRESEAPVGPGGVTQSSRFGMAQRGGLDLESVLKLLGLDFMWEALTDAESRMLSHRRNVMSKTDEAVRRAGFRDLADFRAQTSMTRGRAMVSTRKVKLGGKEVEITLGQYLKLLAMDNETLDIIDRRGMVSLRVGRAGEGQMIEGADLRGDILAVREMADGPTKRLVTDLKEIRESQLRGPAMAMLYKLTGRMPPQVVGYEPRSAERMTAQAALDQILKSDNVMEIFAENAGFTKQRARNTVPVVSDFATDYLDHLDSSLELTHMAEPTRVLWTVLTDPDVRREITTKLGSEQYDRILKHVGYATRVLPARSDPALGALAPVTGGILVLSPTSWGRIFFGGLNALQITAAPGELLQATGQMFKRLAAGGFNDFFQKEVAQRSGYLWDRDSSNAVDRRVVFNRDDGAAGMADMVQFLDVMNDVITNITLSGKAAREGNLSLSREHLAQTVKSIGSISKAIPTLRLLDRFIVATAVQIEMNRRNETDAPSSASIKAAEQAIRRTQNTSSPLDDSNVTANLRTNGGLGQAFLTFTSDPMKTYSRLYEPGADKGTRGRVAAVSIAGNAAINVGVTYLWNMLKAALFDDDDEKEKILAELHRQKSTDRALDMFIEETLVRASPFPVATFLLSRPLGAMIAEEIHAFRENRDSRDEGRYLESSVQNVGLGVAISTVRQAQLTYQTADPDRKAEALERASVDFLTLLGVPARAPFELLEILFTGASPAEIRSAEFQLREKYGVEFTQEQKEVFKWARDEGKRNREAREAARAR